MPRPSAQLLSTDEEDVLLRRASERRRQLIERYEMLVAEVKVVREMLEKLGVQKMPVAKDISYREAAADQDSSSAS